MKYANKSTWSFEGLGRLNWYINLSKITLEKIFYSKNVNKSLIGGIKLAKEDYNAKISFKNDNIFFNLIKDENIIGEFATNKNYSFIITSTLYNEIDINSTELDDQSLLWKLFNIKWKI